MFDIEEPAVFYGGSRLNPRHRVWLRRRLTDGPFKPVIFGLHNPSVAGKERNDPTANRGIGYAMAWGASDLIFVNASTQIATKANTMDPTDLNCPWSDWALQEAARLATEHNGVFVAAWGAPKGKTATQRAMLARYAEIRDMLPEQLHVLRLTASGFPEHPLYLPKDLEPKLWQR